jgi:type IV secretory pathway VirB10-like protein
MSAKLSFDTPDRRPRPGIVAGIAVSVALHLVLLFGYRLSSPPAIVQPARSMTVWLQPLKPPMQVATIAPPPPAKVAPRKPAPASRPVPALPPAVTAEPAVAAQAPAAPAASPAITLPPAPDPLYPDQQAKPFDMNQALKTARKVAKEKDPAKAGTLTAQLEDHPLYPEQNTTELAKKIDGAKRGDCKNTGAGLLSPLIWLLDKKDHGCKF